MPFEAPLLTAIPAVMNFAVKSAQTGYELASVPQEYQEHFKTINSTKVDIYRARKTRNELAKRCNATELLEWDRAIREAEDALDTIEKLIEPCKVDIDHHKGQKIRTKTRLLWILRDSKSLPAARDHLNHAHNRMINFALLPQIRQALEHQNYGYISIKEPIQEPPPAYSESTLKSVGDRRREEKERTSRSKSTGDASDCSPRPSNDRLPPSFSSSRDDNRSNQSDWSLDQTSSPASLSQNNLSPISTTVSAPAAMPRYHSPHSPHLPHPSNTVRRPARTERRENSDPAPPSFRSLSPPSLEDLSAPIEPFGSRLAERPQHQAPLASKPSVRSISPASFDERIVTHPRAISDLGPRPSFRSMAPPSAEDLTQSNRSTRSGNRSLAPPSLEDLTVPEEPVTQPAKPQTKARHPELGPRPSFRTLAPPSLEDLTVPANATPQSSFNALVAAQAKGKSKPSKKTNLLSTTGNTSLGRGTSFRSLALPPSTEDLADAAQTQRSQDSRHSSVSHDILPKSFSEMDLRAPPPNTFELDATPMGSNRDSRDISCMPAPLFDRTAMSSPRASSALNVMHPYHARTVSSPATPNPFSRNAASPSQPLNLPPSLSPAPQTHSPSPSAAATYPQPQLRQRTNPRPPYPMSVASMDEDEGGVQLYTSPPTMSPTTTPLPPPTIILPDRLKNVSPPPTYSTADGVNNSQRMIPGHRNPVSFRWQPFSPDDSYPNASSSSISPLPAPPTNWRPTTPGTEGQYRDSMSSQSQSSLYQAYRRM